MVSARTLQRRRARFGPVRICPRRVIAWSYLVGFCTVIACLGLQGVVWLGNAFLHLIGALL